MSSAAAESSGGGLRDQTYPPDAVEELAPVLSLLDRLGASGLYVAAGSGRGDRVEVPDHVGEALAQVVRAMAAGKAVVVSPVAMKLTTQQAADLLGVSRPTVIKFVEDGKLPAERIGGRRVLLLDDVLAFQHQRRQAQYNFLEATAVDLDDKSDPQQVREQLAAVRKAVAARRRG